MASSALAGVPNYYLLSKTVAVGSAWTGRADDDKIRVIYIQTRKFFQEECKGTLGRLEVAQKNVKDAYDGSMAIPTDVLVAPCFLE